MAGFFAPKLPSPQGGLLGPIMPVAFSPNSEAKMGGLDPILNDLMTEVERRALERGIKIEVSEGLRTPERQAQMVSQGKSQTFRSKHLTGNAMDIYVVGPDGKPNYDFEAYRPVAEIAKQVAAEKGIPDFVWGGDWKTLKDGVHFQVGTAGTKSGGPMMVANNTQEGLLGSSASTGTEKKGLFGFLGDEDKRARLAIALEGMTLNPNAALMGILGQGIQDRRTDKKTAAQASKTIAWLRSIGQDQLANALETGAVDPGAVVGQALQAMQPKEPQIMQVGNSVISLDPATGQSSVLYTAPPGSDVPAAFQAMDMQAQAAGLVRGSPEYQEFMLNGGKMGGTGRPAAFEALHQQALAAGFPEGSPEYKSFMATRGAGLAAEARAIGEQSGAAKAGAPAEVDQADQTLKYIDEVMESPNLDVATGFSSFLNAVPGTPGYDFQNRVNQLKSGAFLTAIDQLRGMGALSNAEGQTATAALARLDTATSREEFIAALNDYKAIVKLGRERAASRIPASGSPSGGGLSPDAMKWLEQ